MEEQSKPVRVGDILISAGMLTSELMNNRADTSKLLGQPLGQTLIQEGDVTRYQLMCVVQLQSLISDGALSLDLAVSAMKKVHEDECFLEDALKGLGFVEDRLWKTRLGDLLVEAGIINEQQLKTALDTAFRDCTPLGQTFLRAGFVTPIIIGKTLALQKRIRAKEISREDAVSELRMLKENNAPSVTMDS